MENFHGDILENILSRLPIQVALQAKRVCRTWRTILQKSGFLFAFSHAGSNRNIDDEARKQLFYGDEYNRYDHAKINYYYSEKTLLKMEHCRFITRSIISNIMVGSCNGLVCFGKDNRDVLGEVPFLICNPLTGESAILPEYNYSKFPGGSLSSGFGYCPSSNKYKAVTVQYHQKEQKGHVQVYTVGGGKWRYIGCISRFNHYDFDDSRGIYANGALHWLRRSHRQGQEREIVAFDLEAEKFSYITLPRLKDFEYNGCYLPLKLLRGNNSFCLVYTNYKSFCTDIWVYKKNNITEECNQKQSKRSSLGITKEFSMPWEDLKFTLFAITRNDELLLWYHTFGLRLYCYDPNTSTLNNLWDDEAKAMEGIYIEAIPHAHSNISLKDLGETNITSLKDLEKLMLQVNSNGFGDRTVTGYIKTTI